MTICRSRISMLVATICIMVAIPDLCRAEVVSGQYTVQGVVSDSISRQPIARALVDAATDAVLTDSYGNFQIHLAKGSSQISISRPGYGSAVKPEAHTVEVDGDIAGLVFFLTPDATITGHITLSTGEQADGIHIMAYRKSELNSRTQWTLEGMVKTNSAGFFQFADLEAPSSYLLYTTPARNDFVPRTSGTESFGYRSLYYPGVNELAAAEVLTLVPGQKIEIDFTLKREPFYPVSISIANSFERNPSIQIYDNNGRLIDSAQSSNERRDPAQISLPRGHYYAKARIGNLQGTLGFTVTNAPIVGLSLMMLPLHPIPVRIHKYFVANGNNQTQDFGGSEQLSDSNAGLTLKLVSADSFAQFTGGSILRQKPSASDETLFELDNIAPGRYWVQTLPLQSYVSDISTATVDLSRKPLVIGPGNTTAPIEITLRNDGGAISGRINQPLTGASKSSMGSSQYIFIYAIPLFSSTSDVAEKTLHSSNSFKITNLAPGSYRVIALDHQESFDPTDQRKIEKFSDEGTVVELEANSNASVQLDVIHSARGGQMQ